LITHGDLTGFSSDEVEVLASIARYHKGGGRQAAPRELAPAESLPAPGRREARRDRPDRPTRSTGATDSSSPASSAASGRAAPDLTASARRRLRGGADRGAPQGNLFERVFDRRLSFKAVPAEREEGVHQKDLEILSTEASGVSRKEETMKEHFCRATRGPAAQT
jgi:hypothetical protein